MTCLVCGSPKSEPHFGGNSCRACAAFFRRCFHSKKLVLGCICKRKPSNYHPCRSCRLAKCLAVGMKQEKIHGQRDPNGSQSRESSTECPNISPIPFFLSPRCSGHIEFSIPFFSKYEKKREELYPNIRTQNLYELSCLTKQDVNVTCEFVVEVFPEFQKLSSPDRQGLLHNFMLKIWNLEPIMDDVAQRKKFGKMDDEEIRNFMLPMFVGCFQKGAEIGKEDLWRLFGFYWRAYFEKLIEPLINLSLDSMEFMATIWILFFDHAYINISPSSSNLCWNIRKVILQELKNHEQEKYEEAKDAESRFFEILEIPLIVERGDKQFCEEMILYDLNKLRMHDDFKAIVRKQRI
ncbi:hypothetical protein L3Y34_009488 [Caenorhabditis briggsae]|uniref:Nuclear receptor domain-containing protein n=2 Tax=Caenorhabditis briggsae TaxID=6238 RepID=A0AAE9A5H6_CAEBR|nr:hypothetical protein L3Y34_009488 [Caenorhabditis briggsae]